VWQVEWAGAQHLLKPLFWDKNRPFISTDTWQNLSSTSGQDEFIAQYTILDLKLSINMQVLKGNQGLKAKLYTCVWGVSRTRSYKIEWHELGRSLCGIQGNQDLELIFQTCGLWSRHPSGGSRYWHTRIQYVDRIQSFMPAPTGAHLFYLFF
jgi:hypothetical protein